MSADEIARAFVVPPLLMGDGPPPPDPDLEWAIEKHDAIGGRTDRMDDRGHVSHRHDWRCADEVMSLYRARREGRGLATTLDLHPEEDAG